MKVRVIGTGTMGSTKRNNTSILLDDILIDCGMGTIKSLERQNNNVKDINYLLVTHYHADHFFDIPNLIIGRKIRNEMDNKLLIIGPTDIQEKVEAMMQFSFDKKVSLKEYANIEFIAMKTEEKIKIDDIEIIAYDMLHGDYIPNYGYTIIKENKKVSFTGDTTLCENLQIMCKSSNYIFIDATKLNDTTKEHLSLAEVNKLADIYKNCEFYPVHRGDYKIKFISNSNIKIVNDKEEFVI